MEVSLNEAETRYYRDLFVCCDVEKTGKVPIIKATELFRSAGLDDEKEILIEITSLAGIPATALHISRAQFFSCLKLIAAHQAEIPLRKELIVASNVPLPLPRFSWKQSPSVMEVVAPQANGGLSNAIQPPPQNSERKSSLTHHGSRRNSSAQQQQQMQQEAAVNSDVPSTDSEVEQNESSCGVAESGHGSSGREMRRRRAGSPEAWSTNSDSPTPTNSVAERPWAKENLWHGLLGDEHRQLLGTEEESSDRHSSDDEETDLETVYQITPEQREYYYKQFKFVQHDPNGLLSGQVAKDFFEKSRIPVEELRHIWQLCDVTRDGALSLSEFTAAMHLVVLRRNNIPLPTTLPACLHPNVLQHSANAASPPLVSAPAPPREPPEADLLHLNDDDEEENTENTIINAVVANTAAATTTNAAIAVVAPPPTANNEKTVMNLSTLSTSSQDVPPTQWTKFTESPTSNVSSPGPKPVNFDMQRTAQAVVSDPQILHPVPLRVTPVGGAIANTTTVAAAVSTTTTATVESQPQDIGDGLQHNLRSYSPKQIAQTVANSNSSITASHHRDLMQQQSSDLRAIQRPQPKKLLNKGVGALPPPPQREPSVGSSSSSGVISSGDADSVNNSSINCQQQQQQIPSAVKKDIQPPLPPPRPHRHGRSNSLDLNKFKIGSSGGGPQTEITAQASFDLQTSTGFADFTQFYDDGAKCVSDENAEQQHSLPPQQHQQQHLIENQKQQQLQAQAQPTAALPLSRISLQSNQRVSAFEVYRKPNTPRNSQSPPLAALPVAGGANSTAVVGGTHNQFFMHAAPFGAAGAAAIAGIVPLPNAEIYEKRVNAITDTLRHVSFKPESNMTDILRHLREQNGLLLHLCNDLSDELLTVQTRKEELRQKLEAIDLTATAVNNSGGSGGVRSGLVVAPPRTSSSISAPVTANVTGGSGSSGLNSNV